jgi:hypothetical protein
MVGEQILYADDDDDELLEEIDGDAWKRASPRQSQVKGRDSEE